MIKVDLSIIIVNFNVKEFIQNLLHSIEKATADIEAEVIIVDNASTDGSVEFIKERFPKVKLIANENNLGFSKANNIGLKLAQGEFILLLNPDTLVGEDTFLKMIEFFKEHPKAGLAGCKVLKPDGTFYLPCRRSFPGPWTSFCKVTGLSNLFPNNKLFARYNLTYLDENQTYEVDAISGSFMMFTREVYENVGGLDEQFFMYGEDLDFCYRIQKAGYKVYYYNETQIIHYIGESTKRSSFDETKVFYEAMHLFVKKHLSSSFIVEVILRSAIAARGFLAFLGRRKLIILSILLDLIFFDLTLITAEKIYTSFVRWRGFPEFGLPIVLTIPALIQIVTALSLKVYKRESFSFLRNFASIIISFFILSSLTFFFKQYAYSRAVILITYFFLFFSLSLWRVLLKIFFRIGIRSDVLSYKRALIVGINSPAVTIADKLKNNPNVHHSVLGLIGFSAADIGKKVGDNEVIGTTENIIKIINDKKIDEVIFSSDELSYNEMMKIVTESQNRDVEFKIAGKNFDFLVGKTSVSILDDIPLFELKYNISNPLMRFFKGIFDYCLALGVLFFIYPFIYLIDKVSRKPTDFKKFILNVPLIFSGQYSFVGPKESDKVNNLYIGKKGLTGLWYIENIDGGNVEKLDLLYAKNQNFWLDLEILGKSLNKMWSSRA